MKILVKLVLLPHGLRHLSCHAGGSRDRFHSSLAYSVAHVWGDFHVALVAGVFLFGDRPGYALLAVMDSAGGSLPGARKTIYGGCFLFLLRHKVSSLHVLATASMPVVR